MLFYSEVSPEELTKALIYFRIPYQYAWTISTAYRYIFLLASDSRDIRDALLVRGIPLDGNILQKIQNLPILVSVLLFRTNYLTLKFTEALFAKNWSPIGTKTFLHPLNIKSKINLILELLLLVIVIHFITTIRLINY